MRTLPSKWEALKSQTLYPCSLQQTFRTLRTLKGTCNQQGALCIPWALQGTLRHGGAPLASELGRG